MNESTKAKAMSEPIEAKAPLKKEPQEATFYVNGMTCASCVFVVKDTIESTKTVQDVDVSLAHKKLVLQGDWSDHHELEQLKTKYNALLKEHGYELTTEVPVVAGSSMREYLWAVLIAIACVAIFLGLQELGIDRIVSGDEQSPLFALVLGVVASLSTCLAVVGWFSLAVGSAYAQSTSSWTPILSFHGGRLGGFVVWGALLGLAWSALQISPTATTVMSLAIAVVMLILGAQQVGLLGKKSILGSGAVSYFKKQITEKWTSGLWLYIAPVLLGMITFFLPCGFTQSMQFIALATGDAMQGALIMGAFAVWTLPMLLLLSSSWKLLQHSSFMGIFLKAVGMLLIVFSLYNIYLSLILLGVPVLF